MMADPDQITPKPLYFKTITKKLPNEEFKIKILIFIYQF